MAPLPRRVVFPRARPLSLALLCGVLAALIGVALRPRQASRGPLPRLTRFARPLAFEQNVGQAEREVSFFARYARGTLLLTGDGATFVSRSGDRYRMAPAGARRTEPVGEDPRPGITNYFLGNDPSRWLTNVRTYGRVRYPDIYPGVDWVYRGQGSVLEHDFVLKPGASPKDLRLRFEGVDRLQVLSDGALRLQLVGSGATVLHSRPRIFQLSEGEEREVDGGYVQLAAAEVGFALAAYDVHRPLVIDPSVAFASLLGGSASDTGQGIAVDSEGSAYITGYTTSADVPTLFPAQARYDGGEDFYVAKLDPTGTAVVYCTYLGGSSDDAAYGIAVDGAGSAYVTGWSYSTNFPTVNPLQAQNDGGSDAIVARLSPSGSALLYSTYLGGSGPDEGFGIVVDDQGAVYLAADTRSPNLPTVGALQPAFGGGPWDAFVAKLAPGGAYLKYLTYLGGTGDDEAYGLGVDQSGSAVVSGIVTSTDFPTVNPIQAVQGGADDAFVAKLSPSGNALVYSTYLGGSANDDGFGLALDPAGNAYVTGMTRSPNFPTVNAFQADAGGPYDAFVAKLDPLGTALLYSTYLGGSSDDRAFAIAVDDAGSAYVVGDTRSEDFPAVDPVQGPYDGGYDLFLTKLSPSGTSLVYSTHVGGSGFDGTYVSSVAVDGAHSAYVVGVTSSVDFPLVSPFQSQLDGGYDVFVARIDTLIAADAGEADAGPLSPGPLLLRVGCGCTTASASGVAIALSIAILVASRTVRPPRRTLPRQSA